MNRSIFIVILFSVASYAISPADSEFVFNEIKLKAKKLNVEDNMNINNQIQDKNYLVTNYTLEGIRGGTDWEIFIRIYKKNKTKLEFCLDTLVGGKGISATDSMQIVNDKIIIFGKRYAKNKDPLCCPSENYKSNLELKCK